MPGPETSRGFRAGIALGVAIALVGVVLGVAVASIPATNGAISACYSTRTGALRVIDYPAKHCVSGERFLRWNQTPAAPVLPEGIQGTACTLSDGNHATLFVNVDREGAVVLKCLPTLTVSSTVTLSTILISSAISSAQQDCSAAKTCALGFKPGIPDAHVLIYNSASFTYTCPGNPPTTSFYDVARTRHMGECVGVVMTGNKTILITGTP